MLRSLTAILLVTSATWLPSVAEARTLWIKARESDGAMLGLAMESVKINRYNREFVYYSLRNGEEYEYKVTTPWCYKGKIKLDKRATVGLSDYPTKPGWEGLDTGDYYYADSKAKMELLASVCLTDNP